MRQAPRINRYFQLALLFALSALSAACAQPAIVEYRPPPEMPTAKLRVFSDTLPPQAKLQVYMLQNEHCGKKPAYERVGQLRYVDGIETAHLSLETRVRTDRVVRLNLFYSTRRTARSSSCEFYLRYQFVSAFRYELEFSLRNNQCQVQLAEWPATAGKSQSPRIINRQDYRSTRCPR